MPTIVNGRFQKQNTPASMGVVKNTFYVQCYWPALDEPCALFAPGSSGLKVMGPPTPRNVVFPSDTVFVQSQELVRDPVNKGLVLDKNGEPTFLPVEGDNAETRADVLYLADPVTKVVTKDLSIPDPTQRTKPADPAVVALKDVQTQAIASATTVQTAIDAAKAAVRAKFK